MKSNVICRLNKGPQAWFKLALDTEDSTKSMSGNNNILSHWSLLLAPQWKVDASKRFPKFHTKKLIFQKKILQNRSLDFRDIQLIWRCLDVFEKDWFSL